MPLSLITTLLNFSFFFCNSRELKLRIIFVINDKKFIDFLVGVEQFNWILKYFSSSDEKWHKNPHDSEENEFHDEK